VEDRAGIGRPTNLMIKDGKAVRRQAGQLEVLRKTDIESREAPIRLNASMIRSGEATIEAWIQPANSRQKGPARILTLSKNGTERNLTLGQDGDRYDVRFRTSKTNGNGLPSLSSPAGSVQRRLTHVVYTRDREGEARIYLDGVEVAKKKVKGDLSKWNKGYRLALGNEHSGDRLWKGSFQLVALFNRALTPSEVTSHFRFGSKVEVESTYVEKDPREHFFDTQIAPLLANQCLECHDTANPKGKMDLSRKGPAMAGTPDGPVIIPGKSAESYLWELIEQDEMPEDRPPLSAEEKALVKQWIDEGAYWPRETIDPAVYVHGEGASKTWVQRLTLDEYVETVRAEVGVEIEKEARELLPPDLRADGFSNTAYNLSVDFKHVESYAKLAALIVERMDTEAYIKRFARNRNFTDNDLGNFISRMGQRLLRGPLDTKEVIAFRGIATSVAAAGGSFEEAATLIIEAMLQSPRFIYRIEEQAGDGSAYPITESELANRMSYILWGGPPDNALLKAAEEGVLYEKELLAGEVDRMLADPRATTRSLTFISDWLNLGRLKNLRPNEE
ncbi:MAG: LamG-like jellyroll fold domain-containing protein, partial [Verrucomicrobiota bacterium]